MIDVHGVHRDGDAVSRLANHVFVDAGRGIVGSIVSNDGAKMRHEILDGVVVHTNSVGDVGMQVFDCQVVRRPKLRHCNGACRTILYSSRAPPLPGERQQGAFSSDEHGRAIEHLFDPLESPIPIEDKVAGRDQRASVDQQELVGDIAMHRDDPPGLQRAKAVEGHDEIARFNILYRQGSAVRHQNRRAGSETSRGVDLQVRLRDPQQRVELSPTGRHRGLIGGGQLVHSTSLLPFHLGGHLERSRREHIAVEERGIGNLKRRLWNAQQARPLRHCARSRSWRNDQSQHAKSGFHLKSAAKVGDQAVDEGLEAIFDAIDRRLFAELVRLHALDAGADQRRVGHDAREQCGGHRRTVGGRGSVGIDGGIAEAGVDDRLGRLLEAQLQSRAVFSGVSVMNRRVHPGHLNGEFRDVIIDYGLCE